MINSALEARIENGSLLHAYIISGVDGPEKSELITRMAKSAVCSGSGKKPCMSCQNCRKAAKGIHPDIIKVERAADKKEILVDQIKEICSQAAVMPNDAARKVYIISEADRMNIRAQNTLLKVLEEPPSFVIFILSAENSGALLETIRSRCVEVRLHSEGETDEKVRTMADRLLRAAESGENLEICRIMLEMEKLDKNAFGELMPELYAGAVRRMKNAASSGKSAQFYQKAARIFTKCGKYTEYNVSNGHICGMLAAELIELRAMERGA